MFSTTTFNCIVESEAFFLRLEELSVGFWTPRFPKIGLFYLLMSYLAERPDIHVAPQVERIEHLRAFLGSSRMDILIEPMHELLHEDDFIVACIDFIVLFETQIRTAHAHIFAEPMMFPTITILEWRGLNLLVSVTARVLKHASHP